ncbi:MAG: hypothetical protein KA369_03690 [Spirochaetes bacterium]|jgi:hypothetical protein|nr:hypothetical protein [Spirochaetota bacterium]
MKNFAEKTGLSTARLDAIDNLTLNHSTIYALGRSLENYKMIGLDYDNHVVNQIGRLIAHITKSMEADISKLQ